MTDLISEAGLQAYTDPMSVAPGDTIEFKVSCEQEGEFEAAIVRLINGDTNPAGPGFREEEQETEVSGRYRGRRQVVDAGSCVVVEDTGALHLQDSFTLAAYVFPTTPDDPEQGIMGRFSLSDHCGYALLVDAGKPALLIGDGHGNEFKIKAEGDLYPRCWYWITATFDSSDGHVHVSARTVVNGVNSKLSPAVPISGNGQGSGTASRAGDAACPFTIAGLSAGRSSRRVDAHFNGKIDRPRMWNRVLSESELQAAALGDVPADGLVANWDFADGITVTGIPSDEVTDIGPKALHGRLRNFPARGMTGHNWAGIEERFVHAPDQYAAIHFHDDDLEDAEWETDIAWTVPEGTRSGVYALRVRQGTMEEHFPFFILPPRGTATSKALFLVPSASYLAYANEHLAHDVPVAQAIFGHTPVIASRDLYMYQHNEFGLSTYDLHRDLSGVHSSSSRRPILGFRPRHRLSVGGPWQFPADLHLIDWLEHEGIDYDIATDRELHDEGADLLTRYNVVMTGSHPEYYSREMMEAWETYLGQGGRGMYLGANGFYWVIAWHPEKPHLMEVRKGEFGSRAWQAEPGEYYLQLNGERSGLWRGRGRAPQKLFGTGFASEGMDECSYYVQMPDAMSPDVAFIMEGVEPDEKIGDFGLVGGGAAGYEIDRYDLAFGTPPHARLLAYSEGHSDNYPLVGDEIYFNYPQLGGTMEPRVRSDIVYFETHEGGAMFSSSSIAWCGSLAHNDYVNNVARITGNVLRRFMSDEKLPAAPPTS